MPLSRLTPRSGKSTLARQKSAKKRNADSQRHLHLWAAIRTTREELDQWQRQIDQVDALFSKFIVPREHKLTRAVSDVTEQLIEHFSTYQLDIPDQSLLGLWVTENLNALQGHPFGDAMQIRQLSKQWVELLNQDGPIENQLAKLARQHNFSADIEHANNANVSASAHGSPLNTDSPDAYTNSDEQPDAKGKSKSQNSTSADQASKESQAPNNKNPNVADTVDSLEQKLSVERLFRQLAKVLHPDREQDETVKAAKHVLMSECLKARQEKDINALLSLYCEHVGELPDDLNNNSHNELVNALEMQLKELQLELRCKRFGNPLHTQIVERYCASSAVDCELRINNHSQSLDAEIASTTTLAQQITDQEGLLDALDERRAVEQDRMAINELTGY